MIVRSPFEFSGCSSPPPCAGSRGSAPGRGPGNRRAPGDPQLKTTRNQHVFKQLLWLLFRHRYDIVLMLDRGTWKSTAFAKTPSKRSFGSERASLQRSFGRRCLSNATCLMWPRLSCVFRHVKEHHNVLHSSPLSKNTCVRQVAPPRVLLPHLDPGELQPRDLRARQHYSII